MAFASEINALGTRRDALSFSPISRKDGQCMDPGGGSMSMGRLLCIASVLLSNQYQLQIACFEISLYIAEIVTY